MRTIDLSVCVRAGDYFDGSIINTYFWVIKNALADNCMSLIEIRVGLPVYVKIVFFFLNQFLQQNTCYT